MGDRFRLLGLGVTMSGIALSQEGILVVVGLGTPGSQSESTRHNSGCRVVDALALRFGLHFQERKFQAAWASGRWEDRKILLVKPLGFMNRSGDPVSEVLRYFGIAPSRMLVVHDDLDLPFGHVKLVRGGGAGGHKGVHSISQSIGHVRFPRLKLGIGRPMRGESVEAYVLEPPYAEQREVFDRMILHGARVAETALSSGLEEAMNQYNRREGQILQS